MNKKLSRCWQSAKTYVRETDMFGHSICFNYKQEGETFNTYTGGFVSVLLKLFLTFYVAMCFKKMLFKEGDKIQTFVGAHSLDDLEDVTYPELDMMIMHIIRKTDGTSITEVPDLHRYLTYSYVQREDNWYKDEFDQEDMV